MGVTIDSIQIEIESSSEGAARGIDALAKALEGLKKNGSFKTVSNNLNSLSDALNKLPNVHQASNALRTLANSIEKLKNVGSIASITNSIKKLPEGLSALGKIDLGATESQIRDLVAAVKPLSEVKAGGLGTMVNAMKNLGKLDFSEITKNLDGDAIKGFIEKVELLNEKLGPLSEKMTSIKSGFNAINSNARKAESGVKEFGDEVDATALNLSSFLHIIQTVASALGQLIQRVAESVHQASQWDGVKYQFGNAFGEQADIYYEKITKMTDALYINKQAFMENSAMAASMLIGFGVDKADAREMGVGYTQLAYDIWAAFNNVYETLDGADGAMAAVRSAIAGEVEPIRRAGFTIVEATLEQTAANHGLEISLENATEAQKSYLRYLELVDQAHRKGVVGTYAREMQTAEGMMRTFSQQLKSLSQAFGSLFLPILVKVMPYVQAFVELLADGVRWLASLVGVEIQDISGGWKDYSSGASGAIENTEGVTDSIKDATKAAKELKNATLGFDELNVISPTSSTSSSDGGSGGGSGGGGFEGLDIDSLWDESIFDNIQSDVEAIKAKFKEWLPVIATVTTALAGLRLLNLLTDMEKLENLKIVKFFTNTGESFKKIITYIDDFIKAAKAMAPEVGWLAALFPKLSTALSGVTTFLAGISAPVWAAIAAAVVLVGSAIYFVVENWDALKQAAKEFFAENIAPKFDSIKESFEKIKDALGPVYDLFVVAFGWISDVGLPALGEGFEWLGGIVTGIVGGVLGGAINGILSFIEGLVQYISGAFTILRGFVDFWIALFTGGDLSEPIEKMKNGIVDQFIGLYKMTIGVVVEFVEGIIDWFVKMWDILVGHSIVPDTVNAIVDWFVGLPGRVLGSVGNFVKDVIGKFSNLGSGLTEKFSAAWEAVKTWWGKKTALSTYTPTIGNIASKLSSAWESAKTWWKDKKSALSSYTPSIGSIYEKLKERWDNARTWWNDKKTKAKEYTPSIGSIYEKLSERWKNAKDWWNNKKGSMSYTPSIGSITDKLKSAWSSAKSWWNKNVKLSIPSLSFKVSYSTPSSKTMKAIMNALDLPGWPKLSFAAGGGIFDQGSLIWAGERGPEVMAEASGGRTGVMNVQQMQDAVYEGVYAAVSAAMRGMNGGSSGQEVRVYLDGREISSSVRKHQHESGATIMGNEVYAY